MLGGERQQVVDAPQGGPKPQRVAPMRSAGMGLCGQPTSNVLSLQHAAGNRAVARAVAAGDGQRLARCACGCSGCGRPRDSADEGIEEGGAGLLRRAVRTRNAARQLARDKDDLITYTGGQTGTLAVFSAGAPIYSGLGVSGHPGRGPWELNVGPVPDGTYPTHPQKTNPPVSAPQQGVCNAGAIGSGYQELTDNTPSPCDPGMHHYCNISCPTPAVPDQKCFSAVDCWGKHRLRLEGVSTPQTKPDGSGTVTRTGMYLHGGNPADQVSSGCVKSLDQDKFFSAVRTLKGDSGGKVPLCVGASCKTFGPPSPPSSGAASTAP
jgi:hypothetical protein